jgi:signal transduction histidine kinase
MSGTRAGTGYIQAEWPVLLLVAAVLLPTACVLWLINEGIANQRVIVRQKLNDAYRSQLSLVRDRLDTEWGARAASLEDSSGGGAAFARIVAGHLADSAVILNSSGTPEYPAPVRVPSTDSTLKDPGWMHSRELEGRDPAAAAVAYSSLAETTGDPAMAAKAWQAAARCLVQSGNRQAAVELVIRRLTGPALARTTDLQGRVIPADGLLMALHFLKLGDSRIPSTAHRLREMLLDYPSPMGSSQRIFLMKEMRDLKLAPELTDFPTLAAEELAAQLLDTESKPRADRFLRSSALPGVWKLSSANGRVVALFRSQTVAAETLAFVERQALPGDVRLEIVPPGAPVSSAEGMQSLAPLERLPGWQLRLRRTGADPFNELASRQMTLYVWVGSLMTLAVAVLALIAARLIRRSLRVAAMKADLVAAVSHELRTPLSSMQLLVDTLLDDPVLDPRKTREYLELIARENSRLSLLIANFLAFSRMERNQYNFDFAPAAAADLVAAAVEAAGERFREPGCELRIDIAPTLPRFEADHSALVTALANLLDNAYKYTPGEKRIALRAYEESGGVCFEVSDNGIGIPAREMKKIFLKFYQGDRRLSRAGGGCGLGLSIVRFLVEGHGGRVRVSSEPGKGSTFTVALGAV